jgi:hypothetical protein
MLDDNGLFTLNGRAGAGLREPAALSSGAKSRILAATLADRAL